MKDYKNGDLLNKTSSTYLTKLLEIYKINPQQALIYYRNHGIYHFQQHETYVFFEKDKIEFVDWVQTFGVSKTNKLFIRRKKIKKRLFNKAKSYIITYHGKKHTIKNLYPNDLFSDEKKIIMKKNPWLKFVFDFQKPITFTTIYNKKLFTLKKLIRYYYDIPIKQYNQLQEKYVLNYFERGAKYNEIIKNRERLDNIINLLNEKKIRPTIFIDLLDISYKLNKKVNLIWSENRIKQEHDKRSQELTNFILEIDNRKLFVNKVFKEFGKFIGVKPFQTTRELGLEGKKLKHCVASYGGIIDTGLSGIYHFKGYTLELRINDEGLYINQFNGYKNQKAPQNLWDYVQNQLETFNARSQSKFNKNVELGRMTAIF